MMMLFLITQVTGPWPQYGADLGNSHTQLMRGATSSAPVVKWSTTPWNEMPNESYSPAVWDVDGDGQVEVIYAPYAAGPWDSLYCRDGATGIREWAYPIGKPRGFGPSVVDCDGDGQVEVLFLDSIRLVCANAATGVPEWFFPNIQCETVCPAVADVDADGAMEVVISDGGLLDSVYCLNGATGARKWATYLPAGAQASNGSPAVGNLDGDPQLEVVIPLFSGSADIHCLDGATGVVQWSRYVGHEGGRLTFDPSPCIADVDRDGNMEVISGGDSLYCLNGATGITKWSVLQPITGDWSSPAIGDMDGDGDLEVVIGGRYRSDSSYVRCRNGADGSAVWGTRIPGEIHRGVALADMNMDNVLDVITSNASGSIYCLNGVNGTAMWSVLSGDCHNPTVADVDGDTCVEIVIGVSNGLYVLDDAGGTTGCGPRPLYEKEEGNGMPDEIIMRSRGNELYLSVPWSFPATLELFDPAGRPVETLFAGQLTRGEWVFAPRMDRRGVFIAVLRYKAGMKKTVLLR